MRNRESDVVKAVRRRDGGRLRRLADDVRSPRRRMALLFLSDLVAGSAHTGKAAARPSPKQFAPQSEKPSSSLGIPTCGAQGCSPERAAIRMTPPTGRS